MIRMIQSISAQNAKEYFNDALLQADYYLNDQELGGHFRGRLAERLGINKAASKEVFRALCDNIHPGFGSKLTLRNADRRTVGYDINFHCPKSVSVIHVLSKDNHILDCFQDCVNEIMCDIERDGKTRVRKKGVDENRDTGELLWADFIHQTARPVEGMSPDPHLHAHCFTFNVTWDEAESCYKAAQFRDIKRDMPYYQAKFHKNFSDKLMQLGYGIRKTESSFEIEGVPLAVIDLFSKRTNEIGQLAKMHNITDTKELDKLGGKTRAKKQKGLSMSQLKKDWKQQIKECGLAGNKANGTIIRNNPDRKASSDHYTDCLEHSVEHCFERASVVQDRRILAKAFSFAIGKDSITSGQIEAGFDKDDSIIKVKENAKTLCTTKRVISQERKLIEYARKGKSAIVPLYNKAPTTKLSAEQQSAIGHVLTTSDSVSVIEGRAGTGKTTLMKEAIHLIENTGKSVTVVAPTSAASRGVLRDEGFENAETVAKLLTSPELQKQLKDQVLWVDEAGLLGVNDMVSLLSLADRQGARVILSGDTRQHGPVARGDALRVLVELAGVPAASVTTIYRQKQEGYRSAVYALAKGEMPKAFDLLDKLDAIHETSAQTQAASIAEGYVDTLKKGRSALVICPTHKEGQAVTDSIRQRLKEKRRIGKKEKQFTKLVNLNMTDAEKKDARNYKKGYALQFNQNIEGATRGSVWKIHSVNNQQLTLMNGQKQVKEISVKEKAEFDVYRETDLLLSKGDAIRITRNAFDNNRKRLNNGQVLEVQAIDKKGKIIVQNKESKAVYQLPDTFGHLTHAYCMTSHASQGKTVDEVFIYQPSDTFPATDMKQFYVSVSRGRNAVHIYTDDKQTLIDHASKMRDRQSGLELLGFAEVKSHVSQKPYSQKRSTNPNEDRPRQRMNNKTLVLQ
ncbi:MAG: MobF family relaxase [Chitinophagaceae bacterium]